MFSGGFSKNLLKNFLEKDILKNKLDFNVVKKIIVDIYNKYNRVYTESNDSNENQENEESKQQNKESTTSDKEENYEINKDFEILSSDSAQYDYNYKIIIIGDSGVGKTCLTYRATSGEFREKIAATIGFEYFPFVVKYKNKILKLEIWDTCGQEAYRSLIKSFFNNSSLAIIVYAVDNKKSFSSIEEWIRQCRSLCSPDTKFFLIGNKNDVEEDK